MEFQVKSTDFLKLLPDEKMELEDLLQGSEIFVLNVILFQYKSKICKLSKKIHFSIYIIVHFSIK